MKEYWNKAERLRKRINRKIHEIRLLRQRAEGMNGSGISDMPKTVSPDHSKMEGTVFKIMALEQEIQAIMFIAGMTHRQITLIQTLHGVVTSEVLQTSLTI